jgi:glycosyltransferase involved in cell wall biosynthesis
MKGLTKLLSVVIPAYNEQDGIVQIIERVLAVRSALEARGIALELVIVDDGSRDNTAALAARCEDTRVVRHLGNRGYGAALKTGFRHASGEFLAFLDADGTYPPDALPEMCDALQQENAAIVVGSRMSGAASEMPLMRRVGNLAFARMLSILSGVRVQDSASGMRVIRRECLADLYPLPDGLDFTPAMTTRALHEQLKIVEVPIAYAERIGRSKLSVVRDGVRFTNTIVWTTMTYNPVRVWGIVGLALGLVAALLALVLLADRLTANSLLAGYAPLAAFVMLVCGVSGVSVFSLGITFSYMIAIFTGRPVKRGMFGRVIFDPPLDYAFARIGTVLAGAGVVMSVIVLVLFSQSRSLEQLWFWLTFGALLIFVGGQLVMSWIVLRVLEELAKREITAQRDLADPVSAVELQSEPLAAPVGGIKS